MHIFSISKYCKYKGISSLGKNVTMMTIQMHILLTISVPEHYPTKWYCIPLSSSLHLSLSTFFPFFFLLILNPYLSHLNKISMFISCIYSWNKESLSLCFFVPFYFCKESVTVLCNSFYLRTEKWYPLFLETGHAWLPMIGNVGMGRLCRAKLWW